MTTSRSRAGAMPTLDAVAARAGVSRMTASRVLSGSPKVSADAHAAVTLAARELRYTPNRAARSLVTRRNDSIAYVVSEPDERLFGDPFFSILLRGAHAELAARQIQLVLVFASSVAERQQLEQFAAGRHVDGVVLISLHGADPTPAQLELLGVPVVVQGHPVPDDGTLYYVDADNRGGAQVATALLFDRGCRCVATITGPSDMSVGGDRTQGYRDALRKARVRVDKRLIVEGDFTRFSGATAMRRLLEVAPDIDGVFVASDLMAMGAIEVLRSAGRRVPDDVAVVGFDDTPEAANADPPLTTIRQPIEEMGRQTALVLLHRLAGEPVARQVVVPTELVRRDSA